MKTLMSGLLGMGLCVALLSSCEKDKKENLQGSLVFEFQTEDNSGLKSSKAEPVATAIIVSIEKSDGGVAYNKEKLTLSYLNGSYLSKGLALSEGSYNLTEFLVTDANNQVIYATPKKGCVLAQLVNKPLPLSFNSSSNMETILAPEVIRTDTSSLENLGYAGFSFNVVNSIKFLMTVLSQSKDQPNFETIDSCALSVTSSSGKILNFSLKAGINPVYVTDDTGKYILNVLKEGYKPWVDTLNKSQLNSYATTPLQVILMPADPCISFLSIGASNNSYYGPHITARSVTSFYVDWGDGTTQEINTSSYYFYKLFDIDGERLLQIKNNLGEIKSIGIAGLKAVYNNYKSVDISSAKAVEELSFDYTGIQDFNFEKSSVKKISIWLSSVPISFAECANLEEISYRSSDKITIDIRPNNKLKTLSIVGEKVLFGSNPSLTTVLINNDMYSLPLTEDNLNACLIGLLASVQSSPRVGMFRISADGTHPNVYPTGDGLEAAKKLKNTYGWTLNVNWAVGLKGKVSSLIRE